MACIPNSDRLAVNFLDRDELSILHIGMRDYSPTDIRGPSFGGGACDGLTIRRAGIDIARFIVCS